MITENGEHVRVHDVPPDKCPTCNQILESSVCLNKASERPRVGDPTVCFICGQLLVYNESGKLRPMADDVFKKYPDATQRALLKIQKTFRERNATFGGGE